MAAWLPWCTGGYLSLATTNTSVADTDAAVVVVVVGAGSTVAGVVLQPLLVLPLTSPPSLACPPLVRKSIRPIPSLLSISIIVRIDIIGRFDRIAGPIRYTSLATPKLLNSQNRPDPYRQMTMASIW